MDAYHEKAKKELLNWQKRMQKRPSITGKITHGLQVKINSYIPEKVHQAITAAVKNMIRFDVISKTGEIMVMSGRWLWMIDKDLGW